MPTVALPAEPLLSLAGAGRCSVLALVLLASGCVVAPHRGGYAAPPVARSPVAPVAPVYFYPEQGQGEGRQDRDRYECYRWAVRESGSDPGMTTVREPRPYANAPVTRDGAGVVVGAATGAVLGAAVSGPRHAGENMVIGAIFGAALGAAAQESRAQRVERAQANAEARDEADRSAARVPVDNFRRAMSACMQGRGYRVG